MADLTIEELCMLDVVGADIERRMVGEIRRHRLDDEDLASLQWLREFVDSRTFNYDGEAGRALGLIDRLLAVHGAKP